MPINPWLVRYGLEEAARRQDAPTARRDRDRTDTGVGTVGTTTWEPTGERPELPELPAFEAPEYEEAEVRRLTQEIAAPRVRQLRETTRRALARTYENPNIRRMTVREALAGYGTGLEGVLAGARRGAIAEYGQRYGREFTAAQLNWQARAQQLMQQYGNLWDEYIRGGVVTTETVTPGQRGGGIRMDPGYRPPPSLAETPWTVTEWEGRR